jgi:molybdopterin synthase sulfur carrier subunit
VRVRIPTPLRSYTDQESTVEVEVGPAGTTIGRVLEELDRLHPGIRFRMIDEQGRLRPHMRIFLNMDMTRDLDTAVTPTDEVTIMQALSGG